jgi:hypothetical protein
MVTTPTTMVNPPALPRIVAAEGDKDNSRFVFKKAVKFDAKLRLALSGPGGSGKTYTLLKLATELGGRIAFLDTEHGSACVHRTAAAHPGSHWGDPAPYVRSDHTNSVVYSGIDSHIHELYLPLGAPAWHTGDLSVLTGAPAATGNAGRYVRSDLVNSVVYRGLDGHIRELYLTFGGGAWHIGDLTAITGATPAI